MFLFPEAEEKFPKAEEAIEKNKKNDYIKFKKQREPLTELRAYLENGKCLQTMYLIRG